MKTNTIMSFNTNGREAIENWCNKLNYFITSNNASIVLLQEAKVYSSNEKEYVESITGHLNGCWEYLSTTSYATCNANQNNVILYNKENFKTVKDLNEELGMKENNQFCTSYFNNVQVALFRDKQDKDFIVINAHISPCGSYASIDERSQHAKDLLEIMKLMDFLDKKYNCPILLGGDLNYSTRLLRGNICGSSFSDNWFIDGPIEEVPSTSPWLTTVIDGEMKNAMDHFIFNKKLQKLIQKRLFFCDGQEVMVGMRAGVLTSDKYGVKVGEKENLSFSDYQYYVSDHIPIAISIM